MMGTHISRRDFLKSAGISSLGMMILPAAYSDAGRIVSYDDAVMDSGLRQGYLDHALEKSDKRFSYVEALDYRHEDPVDFAVNRRFTEAEIEEGIHVAGRVLRRLQNSFAYIFADPPDFGKHKKSTVFVFGKLFDELYEEEAKLTLDHENFHCRDIYAGMSIKSRDIDASLLEPDVLECIMDLRAYNSVVEKLITLERMENECFYDMSLEFIEDSCSNYAAVYGYLTDMLKRGDISDYSSDVVREHLIEFGTWIKPEYRYRG
jgi:hypothetical protein